MYKDSSRIRRVLIMMIFVQLACQTLMSPAAIEPTSTAAPTVTTPTRQAGPTATAVPTPTGALSDDEIKSGIQQSIDLYAQAYNENDPELLEQVVDHENKPFYRIVRNRFDDFQRSFSAGQTVYQFNLLDIEKRDFGYVIAHFEIDGHFAEARWPFRLVDGSWVLTEPREEQIGEPVTTEKEHFIFTTYPWAEDVNPKIIDMMETARAQVEKVLGKVPEGKALVEIAPIYGLKPFNAMNAIAQYREGNEPKADVIEVYAPNSYAFSFYDPRNGWEDDLQRTLTHEYTHLVHTRVFDRAGRLADWMSEGLAEYVAGAEDDTQEACHVAQQGKIVPILDESDSVYKQDLMHMYILEQDFSLSYSFAHSLVKFTVEEHGGLDGFWRLAQALDQSGNFKYAVRDGLGITYEQYNEQWQKWLADQC